VISAHNDASKAYNLTAIVASLNSPMDFNMYIQNFTHQARAAPAVQNTFVTVQQQQPQATTCS
jgi:hypothetical protein